MDNLIQDIRFAFRILVKNPGFTLVAVLALALGIGANTSIFSLIDQVLLRFLPVQRPEELVILRSPGPLRGRASSDSDISTSFSYPMYKELRDRNNVFSGLIARFAIALSVAGDGQTERASGELVSGNYFEVLGVHPAIGRVFTQDDDVVPGANPIVVLSHGYWLRRFGGDSGVLNKSIVVNGTSMTIVGVARAGFNGIQVGFLPDVFIPMAMKAQMTPTWDGLKDHKDYWLAIIGRLKPGLTAVQAEEAILPVYRGILEEVAPLMAFSPQTQERFLDKKLLMDPGSRGRQILQRGTKEPLLVLMGLVGLVLLIACANVANLLMARGAARQREIAIRMAVGAGRWRLIRQFLVESIVLSLIGGAAGLIVGYWTTNALIGAIPENFGALGLSAAPDRRLLFFNFGAAITTGILFGLIPAFRATRFDLESTLREQGSSVSGGVSQVRFRKGLVVAQVVLAMVPLVGAGLFARSLANLKQTDLGLRTDHVIAFSIAPELNGYSPARSVTLFDELRQRLGSLPGIESVSGAEIAVLTESSSGANVTVEGYQRQENDDMNVSQNWVGPDYFSTMGIPLMTGREFRESDTATSLKVAVINETMAARFFADRNPIGLHFAFGAGDRVRPNIEIVGIVKDSKHSSVRSEIRPFVYIPYSQKETIGGLTMYLRTRGELGNPAATIGGEVQRLDPNLPVFDVKTLEGQINESLFADRFLTFLSICFAVLAALLASIGLYGVMAFSVTRRTREIGIRVALGASRAGVSWLVLREVVLLAVLGLAVGLPLAYWSSRFAESLLFGVRSSDVFVFVGAGGLLLIVTLLGGYLPARRAAGIDPMVALRYE